MIEGIGFEKLLGGRIKPTVELHVEEGSILDMIFISTGRTDELGFQSRLWFGKYKGETLQTVLELDARYLDWAVGENIFRVNQELAEAIEETMLENNAEYNFGPGLHAMGHRSDYI